MGNRGDDQEILSGKRYFNFPLVEIETFNKDLFNDNIDKVIDYSEKSYREFAASHSIPKFFNLLSDEDTFPLLIHCVGGKDRTGVIVALTLTALGVSKQAIIEDYLLSKGFVDKIIQDFIDRNEANADNSINLESLKAFLYPKEDYLNAAFSEINRKFGNMDCYFDHIGLTQEKREKLKNKLLE